ncbi:MAG: amidohydrolase family protein, partial [Gammaproteobacteria bacterium]|nr:amidohydrolase family protein [Gammaproteobacteria bacterium]
MRLNRFIGLAVCALVAACGQEPASQSTDWVLTNGRIYTVDEDQPWAEAVVIRDGVFIYVGQNTGAQAFVADGAKTTDLRGRMVIPGIVDAHTHPGQIDLTRYETRFEAATREEFMAELETYAVENPGDGWLHGCCWPVQEFVDGKTGPDREELDPIFPDRPVWIISTGGHSFWLNSRALNELGIDEDSQDPKFPVAMYKRDESGRLTGWVKEGAAWVRVNEVFEVDKEIHEASMRKMLYALSEYGVTALFDAGTKGFADNVYEFLSKLDKAGELPMRYEASYRISIPQNVKFAIPEMKRYRETYGGERLKFNTIKLFMDGIHENRSGAMLEPYADDPDFVSDTTLSVEELRDFLLELHEERFDLHVHVIGDLATKRVLDAVELARAAVGEDFYPRVSMGHLQTVDPGDWPRFKELGVSANFTPWWSGVDVPEPIGAGLDEARGADTFRSKAIFDAGGNVTFSSDTWTLGRLSPYLGIQVGHTRQYPREWLKPEEDPDDILEPASEMKSIDLMIRGYTNN